MTNNFNPKIQSILSELSKKEPVIKTGASRQVMVSEEGFHFHKPAARDAIKAYARSDGNAHAVIVYNSSSAEAREELIKLTDGFDQIDKMKSLYGYDHNINVEVFHKEVKGRKHNYIRLYLKPNQLVVLKS